MAAPIVKTEEQMIGQPTRDKPLNLENDAPQVVENDVAQVEQETEEQMIVQPTLDNPLNLENDAPQVVENNAAQVEQERPDRMCCFCQKHITGGKLKRHFKTHRITHPEVADILTRPKHEQDKFFEEKRTVGIYQYNLIDSKLMRERKPKQPDELRMCLNCKRFISNRTFYRHKEKCSSDSDAMKTQSLKPLDIHKDSEFTYNYKAVKYNAITCILLLGIVPGHPNKSPPPQSDLELWPKIV